MRRLPLLCALLPLAAAAQLGIPSAPGAPAYLPRAVFLGAYSNNTAFTPQLRVQWELTLLQTPHDAFVGIAEVGGGWGLGNLPRNVSLTGGDMTYFYQHAFLAGVAYRATYPNGFHWGFHFATGPLAYGGNITDTGAERRLGMTVEGRVQFGIQAGPFVFGLSGGWAQLYDFPQDSLTAIFTGGPIGGAFLDWRPLPAR